MEVKPVVNHKKRNENEMKTSKLSYLIIIISIFTLSCERSNNGIIKDPNNEIIDDYNLLAVSDHGEVFKIGNNTGNIENVGQINRENSNSSISTNTITSSDEKIYSIEYVYNPSPTNNLLIYDRQNNTTQIVPLRIPNNFTGDEKGILAITLSGNNLIGVLAENILINNSTKHIININLQDNSISDMGITFNEDKITSIKQIGSELYLSTWGEGFLAIDLNNNTVNNLEFNNTVLNGSRMALINNSEIAIMQTIPGSINGVKPMKINVTNQVIFDKSNNESYGLVTVFGNSIYKNQIYLNLVSKSSLYFGILKSNYETNENTIVEINSTTVNRNLIIIDTID